MLKFKPLAIALCLTAAGLLGANGASAADPADASHIETPDWSHKGVFGTFDRGSLQRGFQVYKEVCSSCHGMYYLSYRNLQEIGFSEDEVSAIAQDYQVQDGPDEDGEMFMRPATGSDRFARPFPNENAARASNNGAYPVDLSTIIKNQSGHEDYVFRLLLGYEDPPEDADLLPGTYWNVAYSGNQIAMPPILQDGSVTYDDGTESTLRQQARDVTVFLAWASHPYMEEQKAMGVKVILFLIVFGGMMYAVKRKVWSDVH